MPQPSLSTGASDTGVLGRGRPGLILKASVFATGCAGVVAEFVLSTLATYLRGDAVFQWAIVMSLMLFAMGLGSRLSKSIRRNLLDAFVLVEFTLSVLCASSAVAAYGLAAYTPHIDLVIYGIALVIGGLIGFEIPLVTRINESYEELRTNIAGVMEKDYYGALLGGLFFAFFALPFLGLTYTPLALGSINFAVAAVMYFTFRRLLARPKTTAAAFAACCLVLVALAFNSGAVIMYGEQKQYKDKIVFVRQTPYQKIIMTQWKNHYWLYLNGQQQFSTYDEEKYHEPLVHPVFNMAPCRARVLILGGGDGLALREIWKYPDVESVTMVDLDPVMTELAASLPVLVKINNGSMLDRRLRVINGDAAEFLRQDDGLYNIVIADLPDPDTVDLMHLYSVSFYELIQKRLARRGLMVTQAASPVFARRAFLCINKTMAAAGLSLLPYHNQVPTMGEWGWIIAGRKMEISAEGLRQLALEADLDRLPARFLNNDAMRSMLYFGKDVFSPGWQDEVDINTQARPVLQRYYRRGAWAMY